MADQTSSQLSPGYAASAREASWTVTAERRSIGQLRRDVSTFAASAGVEPHVLHDLRLALSEALANVVVHAYRDTRPGAMKVQAIMEDRYVEIAVADEGVGMRPRPDSPGLGLGLPMIASLAAESRIEARAEGGTVLLMRFPRRSIASDPTG
jgi:anti-sigma regulatory factor (Ser/Thr protein kinase)